METPLKGAPSHPPDHVRTVFVSSDQWVNAKNRAGQAGCGLSGLTHGRLVWAAEIAGLAMALGSHGQGLPTGGRKVVRAAPETGSKRLWVLPPMVCTRVIRTPFRLSVGGKL